MKIAIIGSGISGLTAAYLLSDEHEITVYEANDYIGGHTQTHAVRQDNREYRVDSGFIVFNKKTYPNFTRLLDRLGVESQPSSMSFSVRCDRSGLEYNGTSLNGLFAQRRNLFNPAFYRMIRDILRFNREASDMLNVADDGRTLGEFLVSGGYSRQFIQNYIIPMGAAVWSAMPADMHRFPMRSFTRFFHNHGLLTITDRPQWRVIKNGSSRYVERMIRTFRDRIQLSSPIERIERAEGHVSVKPRDQETKRFEHVIIATHSDQALAMLSNPTPRENEILGAMPYQRNDVVLHTDQSALPRRRLAWASWNYRIPAEAQERVAVTYNMNILQGLKSRRPFCVSLNHNGSIDPDQIIEQMIYHHPIYTADSVATQKRHGEMSGIGRTHYCGAYWGNGFHEDGVASALEICRCFGKRL